MPQADCNQQVNIYFSALMRMLGFLARYSRSLSPVANLPAACDSLHCTSPAHLMVSQTLETLRVQGRTVELCLGSYGAPRGVRFLMSEVPLYFEMLVLGVPATLHGTVSPDWWWLEDGTGVLRS